MKNPEATNFKLSLLLFIFILSPIFAKGLDHKKTDTYFNHLVEINRQWHNHADYCPKGHVSFDSDNDRIQLHLILVCKYLSKNIPNDLSAEQLQKRLELVKDLRSYAENKIFPVNKYHSIRQPYFVDDYGTLCAVGQLIHVSGHDDLVNAIRTEHNYDYIADIDTEGLLDWVDEYGFTVSELEWIQPGYAPTTNTLPLSNGTNGKVNDVIYDVYSNSVIFAGEFDQVDELPCLNIGYYYNNQLSCLGQGIIGIIHDIKGSSNGIYVFGSIESGGQNYPIAVYDGATWNYVNIPGRNGAVCTAGFCSGSNSMEVVIDHPTISGNQEIWYYHTTSGWEKKAEVNGIVLKIAASQYGRIYAGHFDSITTYDTSGPTDILSANNVIIKQNYSDIWFSLESEISDTVKAIKVIGSSIYFGGTCSSDTGNSDVCLTRYLNGTLQPILLKQYFTDTNDNSINSLAYLNGSSELIIGGKFSYAQMVGTYGNNLARYHLIYNSLEPMAVFNGEVTGLDYAGDDLYIGGHFTANLGQNLNYLAKVASTLSVSEINPDDRISAYPNPFIDIIHISGITNGNHYSLLDGSGKTVSSGTIENDAISGLENLPKGIFFLQLTCGSVNTTKRMVKN